MKLRLFEVTARVAQEICDCVVDARKARVYQDRGAFVIDRPIVVYGRCK